MNSTEVVSASLHVHGLWWGMSISGRLRWERTTGGGGGDWNIATYISNMQTIIDSAKARGITPVIARIPRRIALRRLAGQRQGSGSPGQFNRSERSSVRTGSFNWFKEHPRNIIPMASTRMVAGAASIQRLWAQAVVPLYKDLFRYCEPSNARSGAFCGCPRQHRGTYRTSRRKYDHVAFFTRGQELETHSPHGTFGV